MPVEASLTISSLKEQLLQEIHYAEELLSLLGAEKTVLANFDHEGILEHIQEKEQLLGKLQSATNSREAFMEENTANRHVSREDRELAPLFDRLEYLASICAAENRDIGRLINRGNQFIRTMLESMDGRTEPAAQETYRADGQTEPSHPHLYNHVTA